jgi:Fur family transcriptional regulator, ferric uptake regulator
MYSQNEDLKSKLKAAHQSLTKARLLVFDTIQLHGPLSMNELVSRTDSQIDRATVYRVVDLFEQLEIVSKLQIGWKYKLELSGQFSSHHHHLTCLNCSKIIDIEPSETIEKAIAEMANAQGFKLKAHQLEITGICQNCQQKDPGI